MVKMKRRHHLNKIGFLFFIMFVLVLLMTNGCVNFFVPKLGFYGEAVETAPGKFIKVKHHLLHWDLFFGSFGAVHVLPIVPEASFQKDKEKVTIYIDNRKVVWRGVGIPISIREYEGKVYMIVFDRETDFNKISFVYYREDEGTLRQIEPEYYPKAIATQNMWLSFVNGYRGSIDNPVDEVKAARELDPKSIDFQQSLTAKIWWHLDKGQQYYLVHSTLYTMDPEFLRYYKDKYTVIPLTVVKRRSDGD